MTSYKDFIFYRIVFLINIWIHSQVNVLVLTFPLEEERFINDISDSEFNLDIVDNEYDDILRTSEFLREQTVEPPQTWSNGIVPYMFAGNFSEGQRKTIKKAMNVFKNKTNGCISFVERTFELEYVKFVNKGGCKSFVGYTGSAQEIWLDDRCFKKFGTIIHEMNHALGINHEHRRPDRDDYLKIIWENANDKASDGLRKYSSEEFGYMGVSYDYLSIMHYSQYAYSKNGDPTISTMDPEYSNKIGQRDGLSPKDIQKLKELYNCN